MTFGSRSTVSAPDELLSPAAAEPSACGMPNRLALARTWLQKSASPVDPSGGNTSTVPPSSVSPASSAIDSSVLGGDSAALSTPVGPLSSPPRTMTRINPATSAPTSAPTAPATAASRQPGRDCGSRAVVGGASSSAVVGGPEPGWSPPRPGASGGVDGSAPSPSAAADCVVLLDPHSGGGLAECGKNISERRDVRLRWPTGSRRARGRRSCRFRRRRPSRLASTDSAHPPI